MINNSLAAVPDQGDGTDLHESPDWMSTACLRDELKAAELRIEHLQAALINSRKIGAAIGILMATRKLTYEQAFNALSVASQRANEKLREVADRVLLTGSTAAWPDGRDPGPVRAVAK